MDITITMNEEEIVTAIKDFLNTQDVPTVGKDVEVNMVAGRGANGHSAVITVKKENNEGSPLTPTTLVKTSTPKPVSTKKESPETETIPVCKPEPMPVIADPQNVTPEPVDNLFDENAISDAPIVDELFDKEVTPAPSEDPSVGSLFN